MKEKTDLILVDGGINPTKLMFSDSEETSLMSEYTNHRFWHYSNIIHSTGLYRSWLVDRLLYNHCPYHVLKFGRSLLNLLKCDPCMAKFKVQLQYVMAFISSSLNSFTGTCCSEFSLIIKFKILNLAKSILVFMYNVGRSLETTVHYGCPCSPWRDDKHLTSQSKTNPWRECGTTDCALAGSEGFSSTLQTLLIKKQIRNVLNSSKRSSSRNQSVLQ